MEGHDRGGGGGGSSSPSPSSSASSMSTSSFDSDEEGAAILSRSRSASPSPPPSASSPPGVREEAGSPRSRSRSRSPSPQQRRQSQTQRQADMTSEEEEDEDDAEVEMDVGGAAYEGGEEAEASPPPPARSPSSSRSPPPADENEVHEDQEEEGEVDFDGDREGSDSPAPALKRKRRGDQEFDDDDDFDPERLEDDDYDLLEENLGIKVQRTKYRRVRRIIDDDSDSDEGNTGSGGGGRNERDIIADRLFEGGDDEESQSRFTQPHSVERRPEAYGSDEDSAVEDGEVDDFIVDDNNQPIGGEGRTHRHRLRGVSYEDEAAVREAQDVFGVEFDYDEMQEREVESEDSMSEEDEEYEEGELGGRGGGRRRRRGLTSKPLKEVFEPAQLERFGLSEAADKIRQIDIPERYQTRLIPVTPGSKEELEEESDWIFVHCFKPGYAGTSFIGDEEKLKENIATVLHYIRNENYEVPYIVTYKRDELEPYMEDEEKCWKVYDADFSFHSFIDKKNKLIKMARSIQQYQGSVVWNQGEVPEGMQVLKDIYIEIISEFRRLDQIDDMNVHLRFIYSEELQGIKDEKEKARSKRREERAEAGGEGEGTEGRRAEAEGEGQGIISEGEDLDKDPNEKTFKKSSAMSRYNLYKRAGLGRLVDEFGLPVDRLGESMRDGYQRFEIVTSGVAPLELAAQYKHVGNWASDSFVLEIAKFMLATEISKEFLIRQTIRDIFFKKAKLTVYPTPKGMKTIDENHPVFGLKFLKEKPVTEIRGDEFLKLTIAEEDKLVVIELGEKIIGNEGPLVEELLEFCKDDAYSAITNLWNTQRVEACRLALEKFLIPELRKELRVKLIEKAKEAVAFESGEKFYKMTEEAPYRITLPGGDGFDWRGCRVLSLAYAEEPDFTTYACVLGEHGNVMNYTKMKHLIQRWNDNKAENLNEVGNLLMTTMPHIVVISGSSRKARSLRFEVSEVIKNIQTLGTLDQDFIIHFQSEVPIQIFDPTVAKLYAASNESKLEFPDFPFGLKEAISLGRKLQDPLSEFAQLCNYDKDILLLPLHPYQRQISDDVLLNQLYIQMTRHVAEVGVDFNEIIFQQHKKKLLQFCPGFGPAKAAGLIKQLSTRNHKLENRAQLIDTYKMGPIVFVNCAGYIKIVQHGLGDEAFTDLLDTTRIHPQQYDLATKIAVEARSTEEDDDDEDTILPQTAVEEVLKDPSVLDNLNIELFVQMLVAQGTKNALTNVSICMAEYRRPFHDSRPDLHFLEKEEEFFLLAQETPETFYVGKLVTATVVEIKRFRDEIEIANSQPARLGSDLYKCFVCLRDNFTLAHAFDHPGTPLLCPGRPLYIRLVLENEVPGELDLINLTDKAVMDPTGLPNPETRVGIGQTIHVRILEIDYLKFVVKCSSKTSDLTNPDYASGREKDAYYDTEREMKTVQKLKEEQQKAQKATQAYVRRLIVHPAFKNISYPDSEKLMETMEQGEVVVRPSSKGIDHLTVTWKVADGICQHVDVLEQGKESAFTLGQKLIIGQEEFDDLDEIVARYINPMAANARDILNYKYCVQRFSTAEKAQVEEYLRELQQKSNVKIHYVLYPVKEFPGKFLIAYLPRNNVHYEYITVLEHGFKFRQLVFGSLEHTLKWFKEHYTEPPPPSMRLLPPAGLGLGFGRVPPAPRSMISMADECETRSVFTGGMVNLAAYRRTPAFAAAATPYTPSGATPYMSMTPFGATGRNTPLPSFLAPVPPVGGAGYRSGAGSISGRSVVDYGHAMARLSSYNPVASVPAHLRGQGGGYSTAGPGNETLGIGFRQAAESWARMQQRGRGAGVASVVASSVSSYTDHTPASSVADGDSNDFSAAAGGQPYSSTPNSVGIGLKPEPTSRTSTPATSYTPHSMTIDNDTSRDEGEIESPYYSD